MTVSRSDGDAAGVIRLRPPDAKGAGRTGEPRTGPAPADGMGPWHRRVRWAFLAVIIILGLIVVLEGIQLANGPDEGPYHLTTINVASPRMDNYTSGGNEYWCATIAINRVTPRDTPVYWKDLTVRIKTLTGAVIIGSTPLESCRIPFHEWPSNGTISLDVGYIEAAEAPGQADAGDAIVISGLTEADGGAVVEILGAGYLIGWVGLPFDFHAG